MPHAVFRSLLITPPLTQLNTPYPATAYLKGFLAQFGYSVAQADLGIELVNELFSTRRLTQLFERSLHLLPTADDNLRLIGAQHQRYVQTVEPVVRFLAGHDDTLAHRIVAPGYLPRAGRFAQLPDLDLAFGQLGTRDRARYLATLYIEDLGDYIRQTISPGFAFTRYAEQIARTATDFEPIAQALLQEPDWVEALFLEQLAQHLQRTQPQLVGLSVPFPGNLMGALRCAQYIRRHHPQVRVAMGGGYVNTELRQMADPRLFDYIHYLTFDDGEAPLLQLIRHLEGNTPIGSLKRTMLRIDGQVAYFDTDQLPDFDHAHVGTPDYEGLLHLPYLSVIEVLNPMHRLWSDGRWNKLTLAHGCYWHRCSFCDTTLDYIRRVSETSATQLADRMQAVMAQTGQSGFHFTDEAAPPHVLRDLSIEILRRGMQVSWWTNIRFEKHFTPDLARLMAAAGCIAVSGGLEVASDRLLKLIKKGTNLRQVTRASAAFTRAGIRVHAYLMYGFPSQTVQETVDSLEMVRQLFELGLVQSGYWHLFTLTAHSPIGQQPDAFGVRITGPGVGSFANNDLFHDDPAGAPHQQLGAGLKTALYNYLHGVLIDRPVHEWFDTKVPRTQAPKGLLEGYLNEADQTDNLRLSEHLLWLGAMPYLADTPAKKGKVQLHLALPEGTKTLRIDPQMAQWLLHLLHRCSPANYPGPKLGELEHDFEEQLGQAFLPFLFSKEWTWLRVAGLLLVR